MTISDVLELYVDDLKRVETQIDEGLESKAALVREMGRYILGGGGKRVRPLLTMVSSNLCGNPGPDAVLLAATVEFIHTASLLHDDVVDTADVRRGQPSAHSVWGNEATVLVGDFLYSKALSQSVTLGNQRVYEILSATTTAMAEGEIFQLLRLGDPTVTEEDYLAVIERKTAVLMSASCRLAAVISGLDETREDALSGYGMDIGFAFQLMDDALDYMADARKLGKAIGKDLGEGKVTLPLIHLIENSPNDVVDRIKTIIGRDDLPEKDLKFVLEQVSRAGSIEYALDRAREFIRRAKVRLDVFGPSGHRDALYAIADYIVEREM